MAFQHLNLATELYLKRLKCLVRLGVSEEERRNPQAVYFDLTFRFPRPPSACSSDRLEETLCYAEVSSLLQDLCTRGEYRLVERLGFLAFGAVQEILPQGARLKLEVTKELPPISKHLEKACFTIEDRGIL